MSRTGIHGPGHWVRVLRNGREIAARTPGADLAIIEHFALLHDSRRVNDDTDPQHGERAAQLVGRLAGDRRLSLSSDQVTLLMKACAKHEHGQVSRNPTIGACWDADRLELSRLSRRPIPNLLSTAAALDADLQAAAWERGTTLQVDTAVALELGLEIRA